MIDSYPRIHDTTALAWWECEDRIQVEFTDFWNFFNEARYPQQGFFQRFQIRRRMSAIAGQQPIAFDSSDHFCRVTIGEGRDAKLHITKNFNVNPTKAERK